MVKKMNLLCFVFMISTLLSSCASATSGPRTWIDYPLEENNPIPVETIALHAHASDLDGVSSIEFVVDDSVYQTLDTGGSRLGEALTEWTPPGPGRYRISASATDNAGNTGPITSVEVVVLGAEELAALELIEVLKPQDSYRPPEESEQEVLEEQTPEEPEEEEPEVVEEIPEEEPPPSEPVARANQNTNCREGPGTNYPAITIINEGQEAPIVGQSANTNWLILRPEGQSANCWIAAFLATVEGDLDQVAVIEPPPPPVAEEEPEEPAPPEEDTTPPELVSISINPTKIYKMDCSGEEITAESTIKAQDAGGIASLSAAWSIGSESGEVSYQPVGGTTYRAIYGPVSTSGTMDIYGSVVDKAGNWTPFTLNLVVSLCPID